MEYELIEPSLDNESLFKRDLSSARQLSRSDQDRLSTKKNDPKVRELLVESALRWGVRVANRYANRGVEVSDLKQIAAIGVILAVDRHDPDKGALTTIATDYIKKEINEAIPEQSRTIRIPGKKHQLKKKIELIEREGELFNLTKQQIDEEIKYRLKITDEILKEIRTAFLDTGSIDNMFISGGDNEPVTPDEILENPKSPNPVSIYLNKERREVVKDVISTLPEKQQFVIRNRFGFNKEGEVLTQADIAQRMGVSKALVQQLEAQALKSLRSPSLVLKLRDFMD